MRIFQLSVCTRYGKLEINSLRSFIPSFPHGLFEDPTGLKMTPPKKGGGKLKKGRKNMAHAIIRARKITSMGSLDNTDLHNGRLYQDKGITPPENLEPKNDGVFGHTNHTMMKEGATSLREAVEQRFEETGVKPRKNSVLAIEYVLSASNEFFQEGHYSAQGYLSNALKFIGEKHGWDNIMTVSNHFDESNPHCHVVVTPIQEKEIKFKNRYGEGVKLKNTLSAADHLDGKDKLRKLQDDFHNHVKWMGKDEGKAKFYRGTHAEAQLRDYSQKTSSRLGQIRNALVDIEKDLDRIRELSAGTEQELTKALDELREKQAQEKALQEEKTKLEKDQKVKQEKYSEEKLTNELRNKGKNWKKGKEYFHENPKKEEQKSKPKIKRNLKVRTPKKRGKSKGGELGL